ncbi:MAG TPA: 3-hydroxyacyl-CoA dehydrogenase NAD-binding domain-containing protein [Opitutaceae bacterium]|nr:3-hydroxyacyl-CoA dehydrogenase NAD-binding domain-containing protein [Opitutaceae bacterium]
MAAPITLDHDPHGLAWIVFDDPAGKANILNSATLAALENVLDALAARQGVRAVVLWSAKERIFIAGADIAALAELPDATAAEAFARRGQALFQRIADLPVIVIAAIHGAAAGGGYEVALAAHYRLASESPATVIGLPEVSLGTIPGWGGCARLPRLIGVSAAVEHILAARLLPAEQAKAVGLVDELAPAEGFRDAARAVALRLAENGVPARALAPGEMGTEAIDSRRARVLERTRGLQPAPVALLDVIARSFGGSLENALVEEARQFGRVTVTPECCGLVRTFFLKEAFKKPAVGAWFPGTRAEAHAPVARVGVIGAGVMGSGIAQWLAARGLAVVLKDVDEPVLGHAREIIANLFDEAVRRGKTSAAEAEAGIAAICTTTEWDGLAECDLIIEAIIEDLAAKQALFRKLASLVPPSTILASNTSALPIDEIGADVPRPERVVGIHFFNPVSRMPLVEVILGPRTARATADRVAAWTRAIGKSAVFCRSSPGFIVTRILFFYLNEAVRVWSTQPDTRAIDEAMLDFGMPMGPLRLIDEVGIDVTASIMEGMSGYYAGRFTPATAAAKLVAASLKGRKSGAGFYTYSGRREVVNDEAAAIAGAAPSGEPLTAAQIRERLLDLMVREAHGCLEEGVVKSADDIDFAMLLGTGFPAFRGGLTHWAKAAGKL